MRSEEELALSQEAWWLIPRSPGTGHMRLVFSAKPLWHPLQNCVFRCRPPLPSNCMHLRGHGEQWQSGVRPSLQGPLRAALWNSPGLRDEGGGRPSPHEPRGPSVDRGTEVCRRSEVSQSLWSHGHVEGGITRCSPGRGPNPGCVSHELGDSGQDTRHL